MATYNPVSQTELYRLISGAAAARRKPDYYGIGATLSGLGDAYDAMNRSVIGANQAQASNAQTMARLDAGYYPMQVTEQMAGMEAKIYDTNQLMARKKAVEAAHRAAAAQGMVSNTPQYDLFMRGELTKGPFEASQIGEKLGQRGIDSLRMAQVGTANIKRKIEDKIRAKFATEEFMKEIPGALAAVGMSPQEHSIITRNVWMSALQKAKQRMLDEEIKVSYDYENGLYTAVDGKNQTFEIPDNFLAPAYAGGGTTGPAKALEAEYRKMLDFERQQELAKKTSPLDPVGATGRAATVRTPTATKPQLDPEIKQLHADYNARKRERATLARAKKEDRDEEYIKQLDEEIKELRDQLYGIVPDEEKSDFDIGSNAARMGMRRPPPAPNLGLVPDDLQQPQQVQPIQQVVTEPRFMPSMFGVPVL